MNHSPLGQARTIDQLHGLNLDAFGLLYGLERRDNMRGLAETDHDFRLRILHEIVIINRASPPPIQPLNDDGIPLDLFVEIMRAPIETKPSAKNHAIAVAQQFLMDLGYEITEPGMMPVPTDLPRAPRTLGEVRLPSNMIFVRLRAVATWKDPLSPLRSPADIKEALAQQLIEELMKQDIDFTASLGPDGGTTYVMEVHVAIPDPIPF